MGIQNTHARVSSQLKQVFPFKIVAAHLAALLALACSLLLLMLVLRRSCAVLLWQPEVVSAWLVQPASRYPASMWLPNGAPPTSGRLQVPKDLT